MRHLSLQACQRPLIDAASPDLNIVADKAQDVLDQLHQAAAKLSIPSGEAGPGNGYARSEHAVVWLIQRAFASLLWRGARLVLYRARSTNSGKGLVSPQTASA